MKRTMYAVCAVILVVAVILAACQSAQPVQVPQPVHVVVDNAAEFPVAEGVVGEAGGEQGLVGAPTNIRSLIAGEIYDKGTLAVDGATTLTGAVTAASTLAVTGATTLTGAVTTSGAVTAGTTLASTTSASVGTSLSVGTSIIHGSQTAITVTNGSTIAVTDDVVPLTAAGGVGTSTITGCSTLGKITTFYNTANQTITITDTGTLKLSGNAALGQYDSLVTVGDGTNCVELAQADN